MAAPKATSSSHPNSEARGYREVQGKPAVQPAAKTAPAIVLFGSDEEGKARAARFRPDDAQLATKAAATMKLRILKVTNAEAEVVAGQLPLGRIYATGLAFIPEVKQPLLERLQELAEPKPAAPGLPKSFDAIDVGHLVIARDMPSDQWFEAILTGKDKDKDMLTLKWRNYPLSPPFSCHRAAVALLKATV
jgi:hypothetical protein